MMNLEIPDSIETRLVSEAKRLGVDAASYARLILERGLGARSIDEVLAPFRKQVAESGMSDEQLDDLMQQSRNESWREGRGEKK